MNLEIKWMSLTFHLVCIVAPVIWPKRIKKTVLATTFLPVEVVCGHKVSFNVLEILLINKLSRINAAIPDS